MRNPLAILFILLWLIFGWFLHKDYCACCCNPDGAKKLITGDSTQRMNQSGPLMFNYDSEKSIRGEGWEAYKKQILSQLSDQHLLELNGWYRSDEKNNSKYENLGMARAHDARSLFPEVKEDHIRYLSTLLNDAVPDKLKPFTSVEIASRLNQVNIKEIANKTLIYFLSNSTSKINSKDVESYLDDVAKRVISSKEKVRLVGYTDNVGNDDSNLKLGLMRAEVIKAYLVKKGTPPSSILTDSKGKLLPIASNDNNEGKAKNRRTELEIIK
jgi:outer membrane protein OmpA-like peptidoglycan-associated protein